MKPVKISLNVPMLTTVLLLGVLVGYEVFAGRAMAPAAPPVVAVVRIEPLFDGLEQTADAAAAVERLVADLEAEKKLRVEATAALEEQYGDAVDAKQREEFVDRIALETLKNESWYQTARQRLEIDKAVYLQNLYKTIVEAIDTLALTEGYDLVILDDSGDALPFKRNSRVVPQEQVRQQLILRKVLFVNPTLDITEDLIMRMNNEFNSVQSGP